jgi:hypothetical protein
MPYLVAAAALLVLAVLAIGLWRRKGEARAGAGALAAAGAEAARGSVSAAAAASVFRDLRALLFATDPAAARIPDPVPGTRNGTWGVVMEVGSAAGTATVVALGDGSASLYTSSGGGVIGAGRHERVARAALSFIETADGLGTGADPTTDPPLPRAHEVRFHWLTRRGIRTAVAREVGLKSGTSALAPLHGAGQCLIDEIRRSEGG